MNYDMSDPVIREDEQKEKKRAYDRVYRQTYYQANKERERANQKVYRQENKDLHAAYRKAYYAANSDTAKAYSQAYRKDHPESVKAKKKRYQEKHKDQVREYKKKYFQKNKDRIRAYQMVRRYGLEPAQYEELMRQCDGRCPGCQVVFSDVTAEQPHVDHCHQTGAIRGLLCRQCNLLIGYADDTPKILRACARYLEKHANELRTKVR